jgi:hypothetical protein
MILRAMNVNARPSGNWWNHDGAAGTKVGHRSGKSALPLTWVARYLAVHTSCYAGAAGEKKPPSRFITVRCLFRCRPFADL